MANTWNQVGTLRGPQGERGATGATGAKGGSVRVASISVPAGGDVAFSALSPSDGVQVGDVVLDKDGSLFAVSAVDAGNSTARVGAAISGVSFGLGDVVEARHYSPNVTVSVEISSRVTTATGAGVAVTYGASPGATSFG